MMESKTDWGNRGQGEALGKGITVYRERAVKVIETALEAKADQRGFFAREEVQIPPESPFVEMIITYGNETGDDSFAPNALFLVSSMVFANDTYNFFNRLNDMERLREYAWIFDPLAAIMSDELEVACAEFMVPGGYQRKSIGQWRHNCNILVKEYDADIRNLFRSKGNDAKSIYDELVVYPSAKNKKGIRRFGPKLTPLLLQWMKQYLDYPFENIEAIGLPVDFQLARVMIQTGAVELEGSTPNHYLLHGVLYPLFMSICEDNNLDSRYVSEALWLLGYWGCNQADHSDCPVESLCCGVLPRKKYDKRGRFDPNDIAYFLVDDVG